MSYLANVLAAGVCCVLVAAIAVLMGLTWHEAATIRARGCDEWPDDLTDRHDVTR